MYETTILRQFAGLTLERIPDEGTILNLRRLLEKHELTTGILGVINGYLGDRGLCWLHRRLKALRTCRPRSDLAGRGTSQYLQETR